MQSDSYCIDSGGFTDLLTEDLDGTPRPYDAVTAPRGDGSDFDMGAYEFVGVGRPNQPPSQPSNISPPDGATDQLPILTLVSSTFMDPDGDLHSGTQYQVAIDPLFANLTINSATIPSPTTAAPVPPQLLLLGTTYWWRVRYLDHLNEWSPWSTPTRFTTKVVSGFIVPDQYPTIQAAIDAAPANGGKIVVAPGTYYENLTTRAKNFTLTSIDPDDDFVVKETKIDGREATACLVFFGNEDDRMLITGLTFTNSGKSPWAGIHGNLARGGVITKNRIVDNLGPGIRFFHGTVRDNLIQGNQFSGLWQCSGTIEGNIIRFNRRAQQGAGLQECQGYIRRNFIDSNVSVLISGLNVVGIGAGLHDCNGIIEHNIISRNVAGALGSAMNQCDGTIRFNTIVDNDTVGTTFAEFASQIYNCNASIESCIIASRVDPEIKASSTPSYSCISDWSGGGIGNISADPVFIDRDNGDYHLSAESPCIDAGGKIRDVNVDFDLNPRGVHSINVPRGDGSGYDIGAFEYQGPFILASDLNHSENVDRMDLFDFSSGWNADPATSNPRDFDANQEVDALDLFVLLDDWRQMTDVK